MAVRYSVGVSSFSDGSATSPRGKVQTVSSRIVALQVASLAYEFDTTYPGAKARGDRLTVNEGIREKTRQWSLRAAWNHYQRYGSPWAPLAAFCTWGPPEQWTSTHRPEVGNALDFGITQADGSNRALTVAEAAWIDRNGPRRGIRPTGMSFVPQERWHKNGGYSYTVAPIPGVNLPGAKFFTTPTTPEPDGPAPLRRDPDDMQVNWNNTHTAALITAGPKSVTIDEDTPTRNGITWKKQVTLCERHAAIDPRTSYPGGMLNAELAVVRAIINSMRGPEDDTLDAIAAHLNIKKG